MSSRSRINYNGNDSHYLTNEQYAMFLNLIGESKQALHETSINANMAGISCNSFLSTNCNKWVVDSRASQHMISFESDLQDFVDVSKLNLRVSHPNGSSAQINKIGNMQLSNNLT